MTRAGCNPASIYRTFPAFCLPLVGFLSCAKPRQCFQSYYVVCKDRWKLLVLPDLRYLGFPMSRCACGTGGVPISKLRGVSRAGWPCIIREGCHGGGGDWRAATLREFATKLRGGELVVWSVWDAIIIETGHSEGRQDLSRQFDTFTSIYIVCFSVSLATQGSVFLLSSCIRLEFPKSYIWQHNTSVDVTLNSDRRRSEKEPSACCTAFTRKVKFFDQSQTADTLRLSL